MKSKLDDIVIRESYSEDITTIKTLVHNTIRACYPKIYPKEVVDFFIDYHAPEKIEKRMHTGYLALLLCNSIPAGTGFIVHNELGGVYIHPEHQHKGLGTRLIKHLIQHAKGDKLKYIWLDATPIAKPLYDKLGFKTVAPMIDMVDNTELPYFKMEMTF